MTEIADSLLQKIADRLEHIEAEIGLVRTKTDRIDGIETELAAVRAKTDRIDGIEAELAAVRAKTDRIDGIEAELAAVRAKTDRMEIDLSVVRVKADVQPDMRLMFQNVKLTLERIVQVDRDLMMLRSAMNDYGRESVTPGEIQAIHQALDTLRESDFNQEARLRVLEAHLPD